MEAELTNRILSQRLLTDEITLLRKEREFYFDKLRAIEVSWLMNSESFEALL